MLADAPPDGGIGGFIERKRREAEHGGEMACAGVVADIKRRAFQQVGKLFDMFGRFNPLVSNIFSRAAFEFDRAEDKPDVIIAALTQFVGDGAIKRRRVIFGATAAARMDQGVGSSWVKARRKSVCKGRWDVERKDAMQCFTIILRDMNPRVRERADGSD